MDDFQERYRAARRNVIAQDLRRLNPMQRQAAMTTQGPLLLLAGAGSGKTTVLIQRIYTLLTYGSGSDSEFVPEWATAGDLEFLEQFPETPDEEQFQRARELCAVEPPRPWEVIAITFTNKAAGELKERLAARLGSDAEDVWASTFHAACIRILRRYIDRLGFERDFTIYDMDDSRRTLKAIIRGMNLQYDDEDEDTFVKKALYKISRVKDTGLSPEEYAKSAIEKETRRIADLYSLYQEQLRASNALDFNDILTYTVQLLQQEPDVLQHYQNQFRYVLVDEYQDVNRVQDVLTSLLAGGHHNLCVVGDDDQAIYGFRGADASNMLHFEERHPNTRVIRLEQNYRSTKHILGAVNGIIRHNRNRPEKTLKTDNEEGEKIRIQCVSDEEAEASFVVSDILDSVRCGQREFRDIAILYRANAQSNALEHVLAGNGVPYQMVGDFKFFNRAEVKDMLAYLHVVNNRLDDLRFRRIVNNPPRGIGKTTLEKVATLAYSQGLSLYEVFRNADIFPELKSVKGKLLQFADMLDKLKQNSEELPLNQFYDLLCDRSGYIEMLKNKKDKESGKRLENVLELKSTIANFLNRASDDTSLSGFLNETALYTSLDSVELKSDYVTLMTVHSAKGLEFPVVYIVGMEDGIFPAFLYSDNTENKEEKEEEERRLCYVAMTRAKKRLVLTYAQNRMLYGRTRPYAPSRFLREIPAEHCYWSGGFRGDDDFYNWNASRNTYGSRAAHYGGYTGIRRPSASSGNVKVSPQTPPPSENAVHLQAGDLVEHTTFGKGIVVSVTPMARDAMIEIQFDGSGLKKLMLKSAGDRLKKL